MKIIMTFKIQFILDIKMHSSPFKVVNSVSYSKVPCKNPTYKKRMMISLNISYFAYSLR